jgi:dUTP pyrophosphatase
MSLHVTKLVQHAILPCRSTPGTAGFDLYAAEGCVILPGHRAVVSTGIAVKLPPGTYGRIAPRTGLAVKHGVDVVGGILDPDFGTELKVVMFNHDARQSFVIRSGYRVAQLVLETYVPTDVIEHL